MMLSKSFRVARFLAPLSLVFAAACGSDDPTDPGNGGLTATERTQLGAALTNPVVADAILAGTDGQGGPLLGFIANGVQSLGTLQVAANGAVALVTPNGVRQSVIPVRGAVGSAAGTYRAFGGQLILSLKSGNEPAENIVWTGVIALNNLATPTDIIVAGVVHRDRTTGIASIPATTFGQPLVDRNAFGAYININGNTTTVYNATAGQIAVTNATFGSATADCKNALIPMIKSCTSSQGTLQGSFNFTGTVGGAGGTITIPSTAVDLPAMRMTMSVEIPAA